MTTPLTAMLAVPSSSKVKSSTVASTLGQGTELYVNGCRIMDSPSSPFVTNCSWASDGNVFEFEVPLTWNDSEAIVPTVFS